MKRFSLLRLLLLLLLSISLGAQNYPVTSVFPFQKEGHEKGYGFRIPSLVTSKEGTLLAFAERQVGLHDHAQNDMVLRRSLDAGKTWEPIQVLVEDGKNSLNDPCVTVLKSDRIVLMYQRFPYGIHVRNSGWIKMAEKGYDGPKNTKSFVTWSDNDGLTWSTPKEITKMVRRTSSISVGCPGRGIQITKGKHKGRIVVALYETVPLGKGKRKWNNLAAYSDDHGQTWKISDPIPQNETEGFGNESQLVESAKGELMIVSRNQGKKGCRKISFSKDGGETWSKMYVEEQIPGTSCMGSVIRYGWGGKKNLLLVSHPSNPKGRKDGLIQTSKDQGRTWSKGLPVESGSFAYSCLTLLPNGDIGLLYETKKNKDIVFMTIPKEKILQH